MNNTLTRPAMLAADMESTRKVIPCKDCEFFNKISDSGDICFGKCGIYGQDFTFCGDDFCSHARECGTLKTIYQKYPENNERG